MLLSALLTSVGINLALTVLFFSLYSILRKQPENSPVYAPRLVDRRQKESSASDHHFSLDLLVPSAGWIRAAWSATEDQLLHSSGLDGVVLIRIFVFCVRVFTVGGIIGVLVLLPVNFLGNQLTVDFSDLVNKSLDSFSISNVNDGSKLLWIHFCAAYIFTGVTCYLLYYEYNYISLKRIECFYSSKPQPHQFTLLVRSIPASPGRSYGESVESFFTEYHPSTYLSYSLIRHEGRLKNLIKDSEKLQRKLSRLKSKNHSLQITKRDGFWGLFGPKVNAVELYEKKLGDLEDEIRKELLFLATKELPAAFVSFKSQFGAAVALHIRQAVNPTKWVTEPAPQIQDVHWPFFSTSFIARWIRQLAAIFAYIAITILFLVPVVFVQGLANLNQLETWFPSLEGILSLTVVSQVVTGYLPSFILQLFLMLVPPVMITLSSIQGFISTSQIEKSSCIKMLLFTIWNIFFANALSGSALYLVDVFLEPKYLPTILAVAVPGQASFFISYVVTSGWTSLSSELFRLIPLISSFIKKIIPGEDKFEVPSNPYHTEIPTILLFGLLGVTYFFLAPLILPFLLVYFCMGYIIFRNQLLNVYGPKYETNGKFWPIVHNSTIFSLVLMHVIAIGMFALKELELASILTIPLPILTLLFNEYCRQRFLPIFGPYPTECLKKKDAKDENDPSMAEFYSSLVNAYKDPLLTVPIQNYGSMDRQKAPLLQAEL